MISSEHCSACLITCTQHPHICMYVFMQPIGIPVTFYILLWRDEQQRRVAAGRTRTTQDELPSNDTSSSHSSAVASMRRASVDAFESALSTTANAMDRGGVMNNSSFDFLRKDYGEDYCAFP